MDEKLSLDLGYILYGILNCLPNFASDKEQYNIFF